MGKADWLSLGDYNAICDICGRKFKASMLKRNWRGQYVCDNDFEPRQPQDLIKGKEEHPVPDWTRAEGETDTFAFACTASGSSGIAGYAVAGCARPSQPYNLDPNLVCVSRSAVAGTAIAGCAIAGRTV